MLEKVHKQYIIQHKKYLPINLTNYYVQDFIDKKDK